MPHEPLRTMFGDMDVTKTYEFIGFGAMDVTKPYEFIGFGAISCSSAPQEHLVQEASPPDLTAALGDVYAPGLWPRGVWGVGAPQGAKNNIKCVVFLFLFLF